MEDQNTRESLESRVTWEGLEGWLREKIQGFIQLLLEEEVSDLLGRGKSERRLSVDAASGYRNGYGRRRKLTLSCGTVEVRRPRVRDLEKRFESRVLPLFARRTREVNELIPELYLHGLSEGDFDLALRGLLGEDAPISAATVSRLKEKWQAEYSAWSLRRLEDLEVAYLWVDGVYVKAGLEKEKAALLVGVAGLTDGRKEVVGLMPGHRESIASWSELLRSLKERGMRAPRVVVGDGHLGIWGGLRNVYPESDEQRCWNHKIMNVLDQLPKKQRSEAKALLSAIPYSETVAEAEKKKALFQEWCAPRGYDKAAETLGRDWDRMVTFYNYPQAHWKHLRTTNIVESPFAGARLRTDAAKRYKKVANATAVLWKLLMVAQKRFRGLDAPDLLKEVYEGRKFVDGLPVKEKEEELAEQKERIAA